jgi:hypothetical protein
VNSFKKLLTWFGHFHQKENTLFQSIINQSPQAQTRRVVENAVVLSSVVEMAVKVLQTVADKDVSESIQSKGMTRTLLTNTIANRLKQQIVA